MEISYKKFKERLDKINTAAIILAAGTGGRFGELKQFVNIHNKPVLAYTVEKFNGFLKVITVPVGAVKEAVKIGIDNDFKNVVFIEGGNTRQESVKKALQYIYPFSELSRVIITEASRPLITSQHIQEGVRLLDYCDCVVSVCKAINTVCTLKNGYVVLPREDMYELLMPQFFRFSAIYAAHSTTKKTDVTDDSQLLEDKTIEILEISFWEGLKLTYPEDYKIFKLLLEEK